MPIPASTPDNTPASDAKEYPYWVWWKISITGTGLPGDPVVGRAEALKWRETQEGGELSPLGTSAVLDVPDVYAAAASDPELAQVLAGLTSWMTAKAQSRGIL